MCIKEYNSQLIPPESDNPLVGLTFLVHLKKGMIVLCFQCQRLKVPEELINLWLLLSQCFVYSVDGMPHLHCICSY